MCVCICVISLNFSLSLTHPKSEQVMIANFHNAIYAASSTNTHKHISFSSKVKQRSFLHSTPSFFSLFSYLFRFNIFIYLFFVNAFTPRFILFLTDFIFHFFLHLLIIISNLSVHDILYFMMNVVDLLS